MAEVLPDTSLEITRRFAASRERVFRAWTDPEALRRWYRLNDSWETPVAEVDLRVGGRYRIEMRIPDHDTLLVETGEFLEIVINEKLVYSNGLTGGTEADHDGTIVTVSFRDVDGGCEVTVREDGFPSVAVRDVHASGWPGFLTQLEALVAGG